MSTPISAEQLKKFSEYIRDRRVMIVDSGTTTRALLGATLCEMGAKAAKLSLQSNLEDAEAEINRSLPEVVITEFNLAQKSGLLLLQALRESRPETRQCLFIIITSDSSQTAVAQAAEEEVDGFILKPYTIDSLKNGVVKAVMGKIYPSPYIKTIEDGKALMFTGKIDESIQLFDKATTLDPKPSLAYFYRGQADLFKKALNGAESHYTRGLVYNQIHYKCLAGLFDLLHAQNRFQEAYQIVKMLSTYFPANPKRLMQILRLAVVTKNFADIEKFYESFIQIEQRNEDLIKYMSSGLIVCGQHFVQNGEKERGIAILNKAANTAAGRPQFLREIAMFFIESDLPEQGQKVLSRFPPHTRETADFHRVDYMYYDKKADAQHSILQGRALLKKGVQDPIIYRTLLVRLHENGNQDQAEDLVQKAIKIWPDLTPEFQSILGSSSGSPVGA